MKALITALIALLAVNFLVVAAGVAWLFQSGHADRDKVNAIREILFPATTQSSATSQPTTEESGPTASQRLQALLAKHAGRSAAEQVEIMQQTFDATAVQLDRREREVSDRERQVAIANAKLAEDRKRLEGERQQLTEQEKQADKLAADKGFQDTLNLYQAMPPKQVKGAFMAMDPSQAADYLDAMQPRTATKIIKEFKLPDEIDRMKQIMDKMRHPPGVNGPATQPR